ncbi:hypothetical protein HKU43_000330 [Salmonella enterica]|nr:hypothetical protein [Salmonella enterica subsp. enterica serovar Enteritidis]EAQ5245140.1 hypothetical protein [Salmonella enterica]EAS5447882.1 hypothetical protein [Salmonella enterica]ECG4009009.1 hypothetical protein [Salmonella enterica subsp. enterica serovar Enteritidis]ECS7831966.1 hypothetical protein [Salmonella enterica subsp. enterica serovar Enteritidis]
MQYPTEKILPAYPFVQYRDDPNIVAFFDAYNEIAQEYLDSLNNLALPCWTSESIPEYGDGTGYFLKDAIDQKYVKLPFIYTYATTVIGK